MPRRDDLSDEQATLHEQLAALRLPDLALLREGAARHARDAERAYMLAEDARATCTRLVGHPPPLPVSSSSAFSCIAPREGTQPIHQQKPQIDSRVTCSSARIYFVPSLPRLLRHPISFAPPLPPLFFSPAQAAAKDEHEARLAELLQRQRQVEADIVPHEVIPANMLCLRPFLLPVIRTHAAICTLRISISVRGSCLGAWAVR